MATLPFVVQPRHKPILAQVGSEESGVIEVERRGYLTTGEKSFVQQVQGMDSGTNEIITLSRRIARQYGLGMDKAYGLVLTIISGADAADKGETDIISEVEKEFAEELTNVVKGIALNQSREELVMAACMIRYRVDSSFEISDISEVHPDIISGLARLYRDEEAKHISAFEEPDQAAQAKPSIEEAEKKPSKTTGSRSKSTTGA
jgi:hypothetical protein